MGVAMAWLVINMTFIILAVIVVSLSIATLATAKHGSSGGGFVFDVALFIAFLAIVSELIRWIVFLTERY